MSGKLLEQISQRSSTEHFSSRQQSLIENSIKNILIAIGENPERPGLLLTPERVTRMYKELFCGVNKDPKDEITVTYREDHDEIILVRDIAFYSVCEHHLIPFFGKAHVAYLPKNGLITGLSKIARVVEVASKRPQLQERFTMQIAKAIEDKLDPNGVAVVIEAEHLCMSMRGIKKAGSKTITSVLRGIFRTNQASRAEVLTLIKANL